MKVKSATVQSTVSEEVTIIVGYSPHTGHSDAMKQQYFDDLDVARGYGPTKGIVIMCMDGNASMGVACTRTRHGQFRRQLGFGLVQERRIFCRFHLWKAAH